MKLMLLGLAWTGVLSLTVGRASGDADQECAALCEEYLARFRPLFLEAAAADWEANITGTDEAFARKQAAQKALVELHSDRQMFAWIKSFKEAGQVRDEVLRRQLDVMYRSFLPNQADTGVLKRIVELEAQVEQLFNTHRSRVGDRTLTENEIREILATTRDSAEAEQAWRAYMEVGAKAESRLRELVRLRNQVARELGFENYYRLVLELQEIEPQELKRLFDELDELTREPFSRLKQRLDAQRAAHFNIAPADLRPWHFGDLFFQEAPPQQSRDLDEAFKDADLLELAQRYYADIGLPVDGILQRSDLYEKPGKSPHAFCADLDRAGDVRVLCNLKPNAYWADTLLHELGHAVYDKYIAPEVPFLLRQAASGITTEGIAQMFGALSKDPAWLEKYAKLDSRRAAQLGQAAQQALRDEKLIFSRWAQVMVRFEQAMYADPEQHLTRLWYDLRRRYQMLNPPDDPGPADYAAKVHVLNTPVYYHNYLMGELFASQVRQALAQQVRAEAGVPVLLSGPQLGNWLKERVFAPGNRYHWNELTRRATGETLSAKYFAQDLRD